MKMLLSSIHYPPNNILKQKIPLVYRSVVIVQGFFVIKHHIALFAFLMPFLITTFFRVVSRLMIVPVHLSGEN